MVMRVVIQRVLKASVTVENEVVSSIGRGLCVLVGISRDDSPQDIDFIARKILNQRLFPNASGDKRWDKSAKDLGLEILCVSQFTLYSILKGNKLDFHLAMDPAQSSELYQKLITRLGQLYDPAKIKDGVFGAMMKVDIQNDGPVTIVVENPQKCTSSSKQEAVPSSSADVASGEPVE